MKIVICICIILSSCDLQAVECAGVDLVPVPSNLVDVVWGGERPPHPCNQVMVLPIKYSGNSQPLPLYGLLLADILCVQVAAGRTRWVTYERKWRLKGHQLSWLLNYMK